MKKAMVYLILFISILASIYWGIQKKGFHEDEYYTYYSSNRSLGLYQPDREWQDRQTILDEFTVKKGEGFNYGLVKLVQSWDVHPPVYYFIFHTACSLFPGRFTKWTGIAVNLIALVISFLVLYRLMQKLEVPYFVQLFTLIFWGLNPQTISCNIFIRMYGWLTAAVFSCAYAHVCLIQGYPSYKASLRDFFFKLLLPIMLVSYLGFLIQYFYLFFFVSIGFVTALWMFFIKKDVKNALIYVGCCAISLCAAVLSYPASIGHIFGGYRGSEASGSFFSIEGTGMRLSFFIGLLNDYVFGGGLVFVVLLLIIALLALMLKNKKHRRIRTEGMILAVGAFGYFVFAAKTALLVGSASNRYEMPVYGLIVFLLFWDIYYIAEAVGNRAYIYGFAAVMLAFLLKGTFIDKNVLFLYGEDEEKISYAEENINSIAVVMYNPATPHNVWRLTDELLVYERVYYMNEENTDAITDKELTGADKIILYAADDEKQAEAIENLMSCSPDTGAMSKVFEEDMWTTYVLY